MLRESITASAEIFTLMPYFLSQEYSLIDATIAPVLWRLPVLGIELPKEAKPVLDYADRIFSRETFQLSLSKDEREMRL